MTKEEKPVVPSNPVVHIATVQYSDPPLPDSTNKQMLIQQFYAQLEQMKAVFSAELNPKLTTNTFTFDKGEVQQICTSEGLKEKPIPVRQTSAIESSTTKKPAAVAAAAVVNQVKMNLNCLSFSDE